MARISARRFDFAAARSISEQLGLRLPVAITLARRGCDDAEAAARFLAAEEWHDPFDFLGMAEIAEKVAQAVRGGRKVTVFGDFDADGVCATAVLVGALRDHGADCDWLIPDRLGQGYGLGHGSIEQLAQRGTDLVITVDNGIAAADAVDDLSANGIEVIVTDHHRPGERLPNCPILHPEISRYPSNDLCGAAVAWKLAQAIDVAFGGELDRESDLDVVALATVADLVPLRGESRTLVRRGLELARLGRRPGIRALAEVASCTLARLDESDLGFRLAPRINAAGRLYRADAGVELLLTRDEGRAEEIAAELDRANRERRTIEEGVAREAKAALAELPQDRRDQAALVVWGRDWHPGVIGIVASRLVEEHGKPAVVVAIGDDGSGRGSGRSVPGFDLVEALGKASDLLVGFGGHAAAAGLEVAEADLPEFASALSAAADKALGGEPAERPVRVDTTVSAGDLDLGLAEELARLGPFGVGNPAPTLLVPGAVIEQQRTMGNGDRHTGFTLLSGGHRARGVAFGRPRLEVGSSERVDLAVRLERNEWKGRVEARVRLQELMPVVDDETDSYVPEISDEEWWSRFSKATWSPFSAPEWSRFESAAEYDCDLVSRRAGSAIAVATELLLAGQEILIVTADAGRRAGLALAPTGLARFCDGSVGVTSARDGLAKIRASIESGPQCLVVDYQALQSVGTVSDRPHIVEVDPPAGEHQVGLSRSAASDRASCHLAWGEAEREFALRVLKERHDLAPALRAVFGSIREAEEVAGATARKAFEGDRSLPRDPEMCGRLAAVLVELGLIQLDGQAGAELIRVVSSEVVELRDSRTFREAADRLEKGRAFLEKARHPHVESELKQAG